MITDAEKELTNEVLILALEHAASMWFGKHVGTKWVPDSVRISIDWAGPGLHVVLTVGEINHHATLDGPDTDTLVGLVRAGRENYERLMEFIATLVHEMVIGFVRVDLAAFVRMSEGSKP